MAVNAMVKYEFIVDERKAINALNKINQKLEQQNRKLREQLRLSREGRRAARGARAGGVGAGGVGVGVGATAAPGRLNRFVGGQLGQLASTFVGITAVLGAFGKAVKRITELSEQAGASLLSQDISLRKLRQLTVGEEPKLSKQLQDIARSQAITQGLSLSQANEFVFVLKSRLQGKGVNDKIRNFPPVRFLTDPITTVSEAADIQRQFVKSGKGTLGILQALSGLLAAAKESKVETGKIGPLLARPAQPGQAVGIDLAETLTAAAVAVAGVQDPNESATQLRALFTDIGKQSGLRFLKAIALEDGMVAMLEKVGKLTEDRINQLFTNVRSAASARFLSKPKQIQQFIKTLPIVQLGLEQGGTGGNLDFVAQQQRTANLDLKARITQELNTSKAMQEIAQDQPLAEARDAVLEVGNRVVEFANKTSAGGGIKGAALQVLTDLQNFGRFFLRPLLSNEQILASQQAQFDFAVQTGGMTQEQINAGQEMLDALLVTTQIARENAGGKRFTKGTEVFDTTSLFAEGMRQAVSSLFNADVAPLAAFFRRALDEALIPEEDLANTLAPTAPLLRPGFRVIRVAEPVFRQLERTVIVPPVP